MSKYTPEGLKELSMEKLIAYAVDLDRAVKEGTKELNKAKAELQSRAESTLQERRIKFTQFHGSVNSFIMVSLAQKLDILNMPKLKEVLGQELLAEKITVKPQEIKYDIDDKFKKALMALVMNDYCNEYTVEDILNQSGMDMTEGQKQVILKKLKGDYAKDKEVLVSTLDLEDEEAALDEELYYIYQIKNWELIQAFFNVEQLAETGELVRMYVAVDETPKIELKYA